jgi:hypothetical protein
MSTTQRFYKEVPDPKRPGKTRHVNPSAIA